MTIGGFCWPQLKTVKGQTPRRGPLVSHLVPLPEKKIVDFYDRHNLGIKINDTTVSWDWDEWEEEAKEEKFITAVKIRS